MKTSIGADDDGWFKKEFEKIEGTMAVEHIGQEETLAGVGSEVIAVLSEMLGELVEDETLISNLAKWIRKVYLALIAEGFTEDQAIKFVSSQKFPGMGS